MFVMFFSLAQPLMWKWVWPSALKLFHDHAHHSAIVPLRIDTDTHTHTHSGFKRGALPELADVYLALNDLEPRPSLETSIKMTVLKLLRFAPREEQREVYESLLSPLTTAVSV